MKNIKKIGKSFRYTILFIVVTNILIIGGLWIYSTYDYFNEEMVSIKEEYTTKEKDRVKNLINDTIKNIEYRKSETDKVLERQIKERIYEAHDIASIIYEKNKGVKSNKEIEKLIKETLEVIQFDSGRGYYFGGNINNGELLFTSNSNYTGKMVLDYQNSNGNYIFREMIDLVNKNKESFYEYLWLKRGDDAYNHKKKSYLKLFEPLNLWFGTGAYFEDIEKDIKEDFLKEVTHRSSNNKNYIFILDSMGNLLTTENIDEQKFIGDNLWKLKNSNNKNIIQEIVQISKNPQGGFVNYKWKKPGEKEEVSKMTFVRSIDDWGWIIGAGVYLDDIDKRISIHKSILKEQFKESLMKILFFIFLIGIITFLSELYIMKKIKKFIEESEMIYKTLINLSLDGIYLGNEKGEIIDCNLSAHRILGYTKEQSKKISLYDFKKNNLGILTTPKDPITGNSYEERVFTKKNGKYIFLEVNSKYIKLNNKKMIIAFVRDITNRKKMEKKLLELSMIDHLTKLNNRRSILRQLKSKFKNTNVHNPMCISMIDLDHFKQINDTFGHSVGDEVLKKLAKILTKNIRKKDHVGRYGGEEFILIFPNTHLKESKKIMEQIRLIVYNTHWKYPKLHTSFSGGIFELNNPQDTTFKDAIIQVDKLLYQAKESGRNKLEVDKQ